MVCNAQGKPVAMRLTAGQVSDYKGAALLLPEIPKTKFLLADRGYDANWFRQGLLAKAITPCIPSKRTRRKQIPHDKKLTKNAISLKTCLLSSKTGEALQHDMTVVLTLSSPLFALPLALFFILINAS